MSPLRVKVRFFSVYRDVVEVQGLTILVPERGTVKNLLEEILRRYPGLNHFTKNMMFAVNREFVNGDMKLEDGDEVAIMPPVGGG